MIIAGIVEADFLLCLWRVYQNANNMDGNAPSNTGQANQKRNFSRDDQVMMKFKNNQRNRK